MSADQGQGAPSTQQCFTPFGLAAVNPETDSVCLASAGTSCVDVSTFGVSCLFFLPLTYTSSQSVTFLFFGQFQEQSFQ